MASDVLLEGWTRHDYGADPARWLTDRLGEQAWSAQRAILNALRDHRYVAVPSGHDLGKSFVASRLACLWLDTHPVGEAFVVTTAPSAPQVSAILWREITRAHGRARDQAAHGWAGSPAPASRSGTSEKSWSRSAANPATPTRPPSKASTPATCSSSSTRPGAYRAPYGVRPGRS